MYRARRRLQMARNRNQRGAADAAVAAEAADAGDAADAAFSDAGAVSRCF
jgi:hypothetical protein